MNEASNLWQYNLVACFPSLQVELTIGDFLRKIKKLNTEGEKSASSRDRLQDSRVELTL